MATVVKLGINQTAEPNKCGSCHNFHHRQENYDPHGVCNLRLPPWVHKMYADPKRLWEVDPHTVSQDNTCSFYGPRHDEKYNRVEFVRTVAWTAGTKAEVR